MNNDRRKAIRKLASEFDELAGKLEDLKNEIEALKDEESEYLENMPESLKQGEKGTMAEQAVERLEAVVDALTTLLDENVASSLEDACE